MTIEKINRMNDVLIAILTVFYLNLLWVVFTVLGLGIFSIGPATYAMMKYYDRWFRLKEKPAITKSFWRYFKERYRQSLVISWLQIVPIGVVVVNIFTTKIWYIKTGNVLALILLVFIFSHSYTIMAATTYKSIKEILKGSAMLGLGYLHYSIISWTLIIGSYLLVSKYSPALLFMVGIGFVGAVIGYIGKLILIEFTPNREDKFEKQTIASAHK